MGVTLPEEAINFNSLSAPSPRFGLRILILVHLVLPFAPVLTFAETLAYLEHFTNDGPQPNPLSLDQALDLRRVTQLLARLGNPHQRYRSAVHVAGTKGKGSVSAICASVLRAAGYRVGLYTSPHLQDFCERIQVNGEMISQEHVVELVDRMRPAAETIPDIRTFELITALAFLYFARREVEAAVLEVGLGGRLDATNVVTPEVAAITSLSYDHTHLLGDKLAQIAEEKGGIIKPGVPVVVAPQTAEALEPLQRLATERGAPMTLVGRDWLFRPVAHSLDAQVFEVQPAGGTPLQLEIPLLGAHQVENGAVAYAALDILRRRGWAIAAESVAEGFRSVRWPGRFEILGRCPFVVVDGAHNGDSAQKLMTAVRDYFPGRPVTLVFGASRNKEVPAMFAELLGDPATPVVRVILTQAVHPRAWRPEDLMPLAQAASPAMPLWPVAPVARALEKALELSAPEDVIVVCGSLFVAADALAAWKMRQLAT